MKQYINQLSNHHKYSSDLHFLTESAQPHLLSLLQRHRSMMNKRTMSLTLQQPNRSADRFKRSFSIDFPTSPDESQQTMHHFTHSHHPITLVSLQDPFTCSGCKERGAGERFACHQCDFQLHDFCALSPPFLKAHPLHVHHQLVFYSKPKTGGIRWPTCNVCGKSTKGFMFKCNFCHFQMHPCCAMLSDQINYPSLHSHPLHLLPPNDIQLSSVCRECNRKRSGRLYGCRVCGYHLHAVCAKDLINGLKVNGINTAQNKPGVLVPAVRLASQAVIDFIGGLIDGIGEGVGEALVQNVTRNPGGRRNGNRRM